MPTRFYLPSTGNADVIPTVRGAWTETGNQGTALKAVTEKISSPMTNLVVAKSTTTAGTRALVRRYVTSPIAAQTIQGGGSGLVKGSIRVLESAANDNVDVISLGVYVVSNDGATLRGTLLALGNYAPALEFATSLTNRRVADGDAMSQVVAQLNDRIVFEIGYGNTASGTTISATFNFGDDSGTDLGDNTTETAANNPFIELSGTITFAAQQFSQNIDAGITPSAARVKLTSKRNLVGKISSFDPVTAFGENLMWYLPNSHLATLADNASVNPWPDVGWAGNLVLSSSQFNHSIWTQNLNCVITSNQANGADGTVTADKIDFTAGNSYLYQWRNLGSALVGRTFTFSVYVWSPSKANIVVAVGNLADGTDRTKTAVALSTGITRITVTRTLTGAGTDILFGFDNRIAEGGDGVAGFVYAWGAQLEEAASASAYRRGQLKAEAIVGSPPLKQTAGGVAVARFAGATTVSGDVLELRDVNWPIKSTFFIKYRNRLAGSSGLAHQVGTGGTAAHTQSPILWHDSITPHDGVPAVNPNAGAVAGSLVLPWDFVADSYPIYIDGVLRGTPTGNADVSQSYWTTILGRSYNNYLNGDIEFAGMIDRVLTTDEIADLSSWMNAPTVFGGALTTTRLKTSTLSGAISSIVGALVRQARKAPAGGITPTASALVKFIAKRNLAGVITPAAAIVRGVRKHFTANNTPVGTLTTAATRVRAMAGTITTIVGALVRQARKAPAGGITPTASALVKFIAKRDLTGSATPTGTLVRQGRKNTAGSITPSGALVVVANKFRALVGSITPSSVLTAVKTAQTFNVTVGGAITFTAALVRQVRQNPAGSATPAGAITRQTSKANVGSLNPAATIVRLTVRALFGPLTPAADVSRRTNKLTIASLTPAGVIARFTSRAFAGAFTPAAALTRSTSVSRAGTVGTISGFLSRLTARAQGGSLAPDASLARQTRKLFDAAATPSGALVYGRKISAIITGSLSMSGTIAIGRAVVVAGIVTPAGSLRRSVTLIATAALTPSGDVRRELRRSVTAAIGFSATVFRTTTRRLAAAFTPSGSVVRLAVRPMSGTGTVSGSLTRSTSHPIIAALTPSAILARIIAKPAGGNVGISGSIERQIRRAIEGGLVVSGAVRKLAAKAFDGVVGLVADLDVSRSGAKLLGGSIIPTGSLVALRNNFRSISGVIVPAGSIIKLVTKRLGGSITPIGRVGRWIVGVGLPSIRGAIASFTSWIGSFRSRTTIDGEIKSESKNSGDMESF